MENKQNNINSLEIEITRILAKHAGVEVAGNCQCHIDAPEIIEDIQSLITIHEQQARREGVEGINS